MRTIRLIGASLAAMAALGTGIATTASAAPDTTPPSLKLPPHPDYIVGTTVGTVGGWTEFFFPGDVPQLARWTASDAGSGICGYAIDSQDVIGDPEPAKPFYATNSTTGELTITAGNVDSSGSRARYLIKAYDCAGNVTTKPVSALDIAVLKDIGPTIVSGWTRSSCTCALGGSTLRTSTRNAALRATVTGAGKHVALAMAKGPARGRAAVYFDGVLQKTIDTYASSNKNRIVMWQRSLPSGTHTVKVVNLATSGRPRIDVDAFMGNS
jgi:hypothetical protein